jgi:hypothetical protein
LSALLAAGDNAAMQTEPPKADLPKRERSRFQFRLRTLLIGITLLAIPCAYVGWQAKIVRDRKSIARWIEDHNGELSDNFAGSSQKPYRPHVSWLRGILGDESAALILLPMSVSDDEKQQIENAFPEAEIIVGIQNGSTWLRYVPTPHRL